MTYFSVLMPGLWMERRQGKSLVRTAVRLEFEAQWRDIEATWFNCNEALTSYLFHYGIFGWLGDVCLCNAINTLRVGNDDVFFLLKHFNHFLTQFVSLFIQMNSDEKIKCSRLICVVEVCLMTVHNHKRSIIHNWKTCYRRICGLGSRWNQVSRQRCL